MQVKNLQTLSQNSRHRSYGVVKIKAIAIRA